MVEPSQENAATDSPPPSPSLPDPKSTARPRPFFWPLDWLCVLFLPVHFFRKKIHRVPLWSSLVNLVLGCLLTMVVLFVNTEYWDDSSSWNEPAATVLLAGGGMMLVIGSVIALVMSLLLAPAMSGAKTFRNAFGRAFRLVASVALVFPAVILVWALGMPYRELLTDLLGLSTARMAYLLAIVCTATWWVGLILLGLFCDGHRGESPVREIGLRRCQYCTYDLTVATSDGKCPECGRPAADSLNADRRALPPVEAARGWGHVTAGWTTARQALRHPRGSWKRWQVRRHCRASRNVFLVLMLLGAGASSAALTAMIHRIVSLLEDYFSDLLVADFAALFLCLLIAHVLVVLGLNQAVLLGGILLARIRGNRLWHDELARVGYYGLAAGVVFETLTPALIFAVWFLAAAVQGTAAEPLHARLVAAIVSLVIAAAPVLALAWSIVAMVRGMHAARHANF